MTNKAIEWTRQQKALMPDKPFFIYFAPGAYHAPHHVPKEWIDKYQGKFDQRLGQAARRDLRAPEGSWASIPADAVLDAASRRDPGLGRHARGAASRSSRARWRSTPRFLEHTDHHVGRLVDALEDLDVLDDTLIYLIIGDNGASAEGTPNGCFNEMATLNGMGTLETPEFLMTKIDEFGGPNAYNHYAVGWAHAMNTPYQWTKQVASHLGGTRNGTIVHWPNGIKAKGEIRSQFHHVIDVAPTILEAAGLPHPTIVNSIQQAPIEGFSMLYTFNDAKAAERHETQYFEMFCNRGIYHKGWTAVTRHGVPWVGGYKRDASTRTCGSSTTPTRTGRSRTISPRRIRRSSQELQRLLLIEAAKYSVLPLDDRTFERFNPELAGRPQLIKGNTQILFGGMGRLSRELRSTTKNKS